MELNEISQTIRNPQREWAMFYSNKVNRHNRGLSQRKVRRFKVRIVKLKNAYEWNCKIQTAKCNYKSEMEWSTFAEPLSREIYKRTVGSTGLFDKRNFTQHAINDRQTKVV